MKSVTVLAARYNEESRRIEVVKEIIEDDDSVNLNLHSFDAETLEWRAAEYGIEDLDELVEIVLLEPFIEDVKCLHVSSEEALSTTRARVAELKLKMLSQTKMKASVRNTLVTAGVDQVYVDAVANNPFQVIKDNSFVTPETLKLKRAHVAKTREGIKKDKQVKVQGRDRLAALRSSLEPKAAKQDRPKKEEARSGVLPPIVLTKKTHGGVDGRQYR